MAVGTTAGRPASLIGPTVAGIDGLIAPARRRLALQAALSGTLYGAAAGLAVAAALTGIAHLIGLDNAQLWAASAVAIGLLGGATAGLSRRPSAGSVVALVDRRLGLQDRLVTSRELAAEISSLARLQRDDTYTHLRDVDTRRAAPWHPPVKEMACLAITLLALMLAAWSPNPAAARGRQQAADHAKVANAVQAVKKAQAHSLPVAAGPRGTLSAQEVARRREIARIMATLQVKLAHTTSVPAAVRAVSQAQDQLARLSTQVASAQARALTALARSLPQQGATGALSRALQAGDQKKTADALKALGKQVASMSAAQKAALANALEKAANSATQAAGSANTQADALRTLASALAGNDKAGTQSALTAAAGALGAAQAAAGAEAATSQAAQSLEDIKRSLAGLSSPASAASAGQGSAAGPGQDSGAAAANGSGNPGSTGAAGKGSAGAGAGQQGSPTGGQGATGQGAGQGTGTGQGSGAGAGQGAGSGSGTGGHGSGGGRGGAGTADGGKLERVYVPSKAGNGPSQTTNGPSGSAAPGASHPYGQVLAQYSTSARSSLERGALPSSLQNAVKRYFSTLSK